MDDSLALRQHENRARYSTQGRRGEYLLHHMADIQQRRRLVWSGSTVVVRIRVSVMMVAGVGMVLVCVVRRCRVEDPRGDTQRG